MNIDPNTGLPELPPGHFWRITEQWIYWNLKIKRRRGWFTWTVASTTIHRHDDAGWTIARLNYEDYLQDVAAELHQKTFRDPEIASKYLGDYPPKSLNTKEPS